MLVMEEIERVEVVPDTSLLSKISKAGYSISQSISEFVDNSLDARVEGQLLNVSIRIDTDILAISDDGKGMTKSELKDAITLGRSTKKNMLGEYGLGLKTASFSLGGALKVTTSTKGDPMEYSVLIDEDEWSKQQKWEIQIRTIKKANASSHGTEVEISKLKLRPDRHLAQLRMDLGTRFGPFIAEKEMVLLVNQKPCVFREPNVEKTTRKEFSLGVPHGTVSGWYALLKKGSQRGMYGFHTYRRGRLITTYDKIGFEPHPTVARLVGELRMDHVPVTTSKREWIKESAEYKEAEDALNQELKEILRLARTKSSEERVNKNVKERLEILKEGIYEALRSPEILSFDKPEANVGSIPTSAPLQEGLIETRNSPSKVSDPKPIPQKEIQRTPRKVQNPRSNIVHIKGRRFEFEHYYSPLGEDAKSYEYKVDEKSRIVDIFTNTLFPAFEMTHDQAFYAFTHIVDSLADLFLVYSGEPRERYDEIRDTILRKASEYVEDLGKKKDKNE